MRISRFYRAAWLSLALLMSAPEVHAELVLHLNQTQAQAGALVEIQGLLLNETGDAQTSTVATSLQGTWTNAQGQQENAVFTLRTSADAATLPSHTFTRMTWTGQVPPDAHGLMTLRIQGKDNALLALHVGDTPSLMATAGAPTPSEHSAAPIISAGSTPVAAEADTPAARPISPFETFRNALSPYEPIYFVVGREGGATARFQLSFKYRLFSPEDPAKPHFMDNWYIGYTQTALWDLHSDSIPFIDTTYNPSLFWAREGLWESADQRWALGLNAGVEHKSNGKAGEDSRSLNDFYLQPEFRYRFDGGSTLAFQPRFKAYVATDHEMDYPGSLGHIDWKLRWAQNNGLVLSGLYRQGSHGRNATQLEASWPLRRTFLNMNGYLFAQYFHGYGETLLGYNQKADPQVRIGIALVP